MTRSDVLLLASQDDVAVALRDLASGERVDTAGAAVTVRARGPRGHKVGVRPPRCAPGSPAPTRCPCTRFPRVPSCASTAR